MGRALEPARRFRAVLRHAAAFGVADARSRIRRPARLAASAWRIAGLIEAGSASMCACPSARWRPACCRAGGGGGAAWRAIDPVTSARRLRRDHGRGVEERRHVADLAGGFAVGAPRRGSELLGRRHPAGVGVACGVSGGAASACRRLDIGGGGISGNSRSIAVSAAPTTMMATLAAISSVFRTANRLPRDGSASVTSSHARHRRRCRHRLNADRCGRAAGIACGIGAGAGICGSPVGFFFLNGQSRRPSLRLRLRHLHRRVEIGGLRGIARGGNRGRLAAGIGGRRPEAASAASDAAMRAAAEPGRTRGAPLPGSSGVSGGRYGSIGWRRGPARHRLCRAASAAARPAARIRLRQAARLAARAVPARPARGAVPIAAIAAHGCGAATFPG